MSAIVLVVEDDRGFREALELVLTMEGYQVITAVHGKDALHTLELVRPDLILLDLEMPIMGGIEFANQYRARRGRKAPIIIATGTNSRNQVEEIGAVGYLQKPFGFHTLLALVDHVARRYAPFAMAS